MRDVTMPVWQFVRLMVKVEETTEKYNDVALRQLYAQWEDFWADLDAKLIDMGKHSREEFAHMMMYQEVVMHRQDDANIQLIKREFTALIIELKRKASESRNRDEKRDLHYEWNEIALFLKAL